MSESLRLVARVARFVGRDLAFLGSTPAPDATPCDHSLISAYDNARGGYGGDARRNITLALMFWSPTFVSLAGMSDVACARAILAEIERRLADAVGSRYDAPW